MRRVFITMGSRQRRQSTTRGAPSAALIGAEPAEIIFTSGGTEADNFAIRGVAEALEPTGRKHLITSGIEHEAVLNTFKALAKRGWRTTVLPLDASGIVSPDRLREAMTDDTALVSIMHANNEIGTIQPIAELAAIAHARGALFHTDAVQSAGKIPVNVRALGVDLLAVSAHKFYGPKGIGALWVKRGVRLSPFLSGGKQERNRRAGTENVPGAIGMGVAAGLAMQKMDAEAGAARPPCAIGWRTGFSSSVPNTDVNGSREARVPNTTNISFDRIEAESLLIALDLEGVAVSTGIGVLIRHARAVARAQGDEPVEPSRAELDPLQPGRVATRRSRSITSFRYCRESSRNLRSLVGGGLTLMARGLSPKPGAERREIVVAMSGGVDSSVAAALLAEAGHDVIGLSMQLYDQRDGESGYGSCCSLDDLHDAGRVARRLGHPPLHRQFRAGVSADGRVELRQRVRRRAHADSVRALQQRPEVRHAARSLDGLRRRGGRNRPLRAHRHRSGDGAPRASPRPRRGEGPVVFPLLATQEQLSRASFPVGDLSKDAVRDIARRLGLPVAEKPDSQEICFVPDGDYAAFIERKTGDLDGGGAIVSQSGDVLGRHGGVHRFTVGQRKGLGIAAAEPLYVLQLRPAEKTVVVGPRPELERTSLTRIQVNWIAGAPPALRCA